MKKNKEEAVPYQINETTVRDKIYLIRGQKVMLDADLAQIYGYSTSALNQQVKNNTNRFDDDFVFRLTKTEWDNLKSKYFTSSWGGSRKLPYAFTEQGIIMLMTVLKSDKAVQQSKELVRIFKRMKDYVIWSKELVDHRSSISLSIQNETDLTKLEKLRSHAVVLNQQLSGIVERLVDVVNNSPLSVTLKTFTDVDNGWLIYGTDLYSGEDAYTSIYRQAKQSLYVVDNYIGYRTLVLLKNTAEGVEIKVFSDNLGYNKLTKKDLLKFRKNCPDVNVSIQHTGGRIHDRFIVLDHGTDDERIFLCGGSSKDAGVRISSIVEDFGIEKYEPVIEELLGNPDLKLR